MKPYEDPQMDPYDRIQANLHHDRQEHIVSMDWKARYNGRPFVPPDPKPRLCFKKVIDHHGNVGWEELSS